MNEDFDEDEDNDNYGPLIPYRLVESKPISKYTFIQAGFSLVTGFMRSVLEVTVDLSDAYIGAEGYTRGRKNFEEEARAQIETITEGATVEDGE